MQRTKRWDNTTVKSSSTTGWLIWTRQSRQVAFRKKPVLFKHEMMHHFMCHLVAVRRDGSLLDERKLLCQAAFPLLVIMMDVKLAIHALTNWFRLRFYICLSALACPEWRADRSQKASDAREKLAWRLEGNPEVWTCPDCLTFQRMSAERGSEGCGWMAGLEQADWPSLIKEAPPLTS